MKKILTMAAVALLAASCSNDKDVITPDLGTANAPVAIKLTQSVEGLTTKARIAGGRYRGDGGRDFRTRA